MTIEEFCDWLSLVDEIADGNLEEVPVNQETWNMLVTEWISIRNYGWASGKIKFVASSGSLILDYSGNKKYKVKLEQQ